MKGQLFIYLGGGVPFELSFGTKHQTNPKAYTMPRALGGKKLIEPFVWKVHMQNKMLQLNS